MSATIDHGPAMVAYVYAADRKGGGASRRLRRQPAGDSFCGYAALTKRRQQVSLAFCWAHVRRKFYESADNSPVATEALRRIAMLYAIEDEVRSTLAEHRRAVRAEQARGIVDDLHIYLKA